MKKIGHSSWLILTLLYILLTSIDRSNATSNHELNEELRFIHREIGLLRDENHHQNMEIALLKERVGNTKDSDDQTMIEEYRQLDDNYRNKRPVRLLPPRLFYEERETETEQQKQAKRRRYEQPTNCSDLSLLGYTLNGFYTVKSNESSAKSNSTNSDIKLETVYCAFKQPEGTFNPALVEKRIISRRETTNTNSKIIFHATRHTDLKANGGQSTITFENVLVNLGDSFNALTGKFVVPHSGLYLLVFRGMVIFPDENLNREFHIYITSNATRIPGKIRTANFIGMNTVQEKGKFVNVEFDKVFQGKRGDTIQVDVRFNEIGAKFSGDSISLIAYLIG